ncbi:MAG: hypothetical protein V3T31_13275, partial [candidate division Zixibacteria bacterium]
SMANQSHIDSVSHEQFGYKIVTEHESLGQLLPNSKGFDKKLIAGIMTGEAKELPYQSQLIHSTLDADRLDFLLRDSHYAGVSYGHVDIDFLIENLLYNMKDHSFAVDYKGIPAFEHFLIARYFMYNNITYHKTVMGFELMAKVLYHQMAKEMNDVTSDFKELVRSLNDDSFERFDDDFFFRSLHSWEPQENRKYFTVLKRHLLTRRPLVLLFEERKLVQIGGNDDNEFKYLKPGRVINSDTFEGVLSKFDIDKQCVALLTNDIKFEALPPLTPRGDRATESKLRELGKVYEGHKFRDLLDVGHSIIPSLSENKQCIRRLFLFDMEDRFQDKSRKQDLVDFRKALEAAFQ